MLLRVMQDMSRHLLHDALEASKAKQTYTKQTYPQESLRPALDIWIWKQSTHLSIILRGRSEFDDEFARSHDSCKAEFENSASLPENSNMKNLEAQGSACTR